MESLGGPGGLRKLISSWNKNQVGEGKTQNVQEKTNDRRREGLTFVVQRGFSQALAAIFFGRTYLSNISINQSIRNAKPA